MRPPFIVGRLEGSRYVDLTFIDDAKARNQARSLYRWMRRRPIGIDRDVARTAITIALSIPSTRMLVPAERAS